MKSAQDRYPRRGWYLFDYDRSEIVRGPYKNSETAGGCAARSRATAICGLSPPPRSISGRPTFPMPDRRSEPTAAQGHERFVDRVQGFAKLLPEYDLTDPEDARSVRRVLIDLALAAHLIEVEADPDASE